jgi:hypothetical protein
MSRTGVPMKRVWAERDHTRAAEADRRVRLAEPDRRVRVAEPALLNSGADQQYAVLLLNEQQMAQLLNRPALTPVTPQFVRANDAFASYTRLMRHARIVIVALVVLVAGATAWAWAPLPSLGALPWTSPKLPPTVATGASFSLTLPSTSEPGPLAGRLVASGTPAFTRAIGNTSSRQVMVGPFVTLDEAEKEQQRLTRNGFAGTRVFVDDSLRRAPKNGVVANAVTNPALVLVGVGDRMSLAIELENEARQVNTNRAADGTLMLEIGPIESDLDAQEWSAPAGVDLVRQMKVEEIAVTPEASYLRATLTMPASTVANARVEGRRVYIDMSRPSPGLGTRGPGSGVRDSGLETRGATPRAGSARAAAARAAAAAPADRSAAAAPAAPAPPLVDAPRASQIKPIVARFERLVPFLQSAAATASPDVLRALASSVEELETSLRQLVPTADAADAHGALVSALAPARLAVDAGFTGDRVAQARQAAMLVEAAKTVMPGTGQ